MEIKSALEIARQKAEEMTTGSDIDEDLLAAREKVKKILADYFRDEINADQLWQKLQGEEAEVLQAAQKNLVESLGMRTAKEDFRRRSEGILAIESIKDSGNTSQLERTLSQLAAVISEYEQGRQKIARKLQDELDNNAQFKMRPVQTQDGRTVMQMNPELDQRVQKKIQDSLQNHEDRCRSRFDRLIAKLQGQIGLS